MDDAEPPLPFGAQQKFLLKGCLDSIYFGSHDFAEVVKGCGSRCGFTVNSMTRRTNSTTGSRFALDNRELSNDPITGRGLKLQTLNMSRVPNIEVARCHLNELPGYDMPIYLHWLGLSRVRETNYFTNNELAVINMVLNLTRLDLVRGSTKRHETVTEELAKLKVFESKVKGATADILKSKKYHLGRGSMDEFATTFMKMLKHMCEMTPVQFEQSFTPFITGMHFDGMLRENLNVRYMMSFCRSLAHNCYFCASLAGCKRIFHNKKALCHKFETLEQLDSNHLTTMVKKFTAEIYRCIREEIFVIPKRPRKKYDGDIQYHFDFGLEYSPLKEENQSFLLYGNKAKERFKAYLGQTRTWVPKVGDPALTLTLADLADTDSDEDSDESTDSDSSSEQVWEPPQPFDLEFMDEFDIGLFETGEVQAPNNARRIIDEESGDEEGESI
jgi:hypothetical protein